MTIEQKKERLEFMKSVALDAGEVMRFYFGYNDKQIEIKDDLSPLTIADTKINRMVIGKISQKYPDEGIVGEEESTAGYGLGYRWVCDPIDGTKAFIWGTPTAMFSLALVVDGEPIIGVAYEPITNMLYWAAKGLGSFRNGVRIEVNNHSLDNGIIGTTTSIYRIRKQALYLDSLLERRANFATFSSIVAKYVKVAEGRFCCAIEDLVNPHDIAASQIIVEEAGGKVTDIYGGRLNYTKPFKGAIVSNGVVHDELLKIMKESYK